MMNRSELVLGSSVAFALGLAGVPPAARAETATRALAREVA